MRSSRSRPFQSAGRLGATVPTRQCRGSRSAASIRPMDPPLLVEVQGLSSWRWIDGLLQEGDSQDQPVWLPASSRYHSRRSTSSSPCETGVPSGFRSGGPISSTDTSNRLSFGCRRTWVAVASVTALSRPFHTTTEYVVPFPSNVANARRTAQDRPCRKQPTGFRPGFGSMNRAGRDDPAEMRPPQQPVPTEPARTASR